MAGLRNLPGLFIALAVGLSSGLLHGTEFFYEDFDGFLDDGDVVGEGWSIVDANTPQENATWTILNPGGRVNPPTADGTPTVGAFMISDSDAAGGANPTGSGMSHDLWSPSIDCSEADAVWLHFACSAQLNNNGKCVFDVDVSTDGGATWENVFRRVAPSRVEADPVVTVENADGFFGRIDIDLTEQAAGESDVMVRWRHFEPNDDWWIAIDEVVVDDVAPPQGGQFILMPEEDFSGGIPGNWTVRSDVDPANTGDKTWTTGDPCGRSVVDAGGTFPHQDGRGVHRLGSDFAILDSDCNPDPPEDEYLITPSLDCTDATEVFLHWKSETVLASGAIQEVLLSLDGGETFEAEPIFSYSAGGLFDHGEDPFYAERVFLVPDAAGEPEVAFAFRYQSPGDNWWWAVDDVKVTANGAVDPRSCANRNFRVAFDEATGRVTGTWRPIAGDEGYRVIQGGRQVGGDLGPDADAFTDAAPLPGGVDVVYTLQVLVGGAVERECDAAPIRTFACPRDLACCADHGAKTVELVWETGTNLDATGFEVRRDGDTVGNVGADAGRYVDDPGPGVFDYEVAIIPGAGADPAQCPDPLSCSIEVIEGTGFLFFDDFECYEDDDDVTAAGWRIVDENDPVETSTWTITNPHPRANPPTADGTPSRGRFMISDSDTQSGSNPTGSGMSHDLWSPSIDCSGTDTVWLHFDCSAQLNNNGKCVFDVDVSTDDGGTWQNVFRRVAPSRTEAPPFPTLIEDNADGFFGRLDIDITDEAAGRPDVRIRWRHFEPNWDWWIAIDDVLVDDVPVVGGATVILPTEDFIDDIPDTWTVASRGFGDRPWSTEDLCARSLLLAGGTFPDSFDGRGLHHFDDLFAIVDGACAFVDQDEILATPVLDCSRATAVYLHVKSAIVVNTDAIQEILLSLDGGETYDEDHPIFSYNAGALVDPGEDPFYNAFILEVPEAAGESQVVFAFHYAGMAGVGQDAWWWAIDDVSVTADVPAGGLFRRGDADADGTLTIGDAIFVLNFLFAHGTAPPCKDAADMDDDGRFTIGDAIYFLNYLFAGQRPPPDPGPTACGPDPTDDDPWPAESCTFPPCP